MNNIRVRAKKSLGQNFLVNEGVLMSQRGLGACSLAMTEADVERFVEALGRVLDRDG